MTHGAGIWLIVLLGLSLAGCDSLDGVLDLLQPTSTKVTLANNTEASVDGTLLYHDEQDVPELLLSEVGTEFDFDLEPGDLTTFSLDCDDLQAVQIEDADLRLLFGIGPETSSDVLRDGDDFGCGDEIVFTFTSLPEFDVNITVR